MQLSPAVFEELRRLVHRLCGLVVADDKAYLVRHRLGPVARSAGCRSFEDFAQKLRGPEGPALYAPIVEAITTAETSFFRDPHVFEAFRRNVLPGLGEKARSGAKVRLWCAAASTGQEPYSLAMLLRHYVAADRAMCEGDFSVLATDISERVLAVARAAEYGDRDAARGLTPALLARWFERRGDAWAVRDPIRRLVEFRRFNLTGPAGDLPMFDTIFCRNVLIYFDLDTRRRVCGALHGLLAAGGWLVLGAAENLYGVSDQFAAVRFGEALFYRKTESSPGG
jgi:chemotaxis protein methyltransferase CheR